MPFGFVVLKGIAIFLELVPAPLLYGSEQNFAGLHSICLRAPRKRDCDEVRIARRQHVDVVRLKRPTSAERAPFLFVNVCKTKAFHGLHRPLRGLFPFGRSSEARAIEI